jgi:hypothetical protein
MRTFGTEKNYAVWDDQVTEILLQERTTGTGLFINRDDVMPRYLKAREEQKSRTDSKAEVFTPYEIVKEMNDNVQKNFDGSIGDYIKRTVLEVTCGEAPFLTTRYDAATGVEISVENRTGLLDRKLCCIPAVVGKDGYVECATAALKSAYGYEWQYDSLFLARRNLLMTTIEHYENVWKTEPSYETVLNWASIISYNIIRMDGVTLCLPETDIPAKVMNWETGKVERFAA